MLFPLFIGLLNYRRESDWISTICLWWMHADCPCLLFLHIAFLEIYLKWTCFLSQCWGEVLLSLTLFKDGSNINLMSSHWGPPSITVVNPSWPHRSESVQLVGAAAKLLLPYCCLSLSFSNCTSVCTRPGAGTDCKDQSKKGIENTAAKWETTVELAKYTKWKEEHGFVALRSLQPISFYHIGSDFAFVQFNSKFLNTALEKIGVVYFTNAFTWRMYHSIHSLYVSNWITQL